MHVELVRRLLYYLIEHTLTHHLWLLIYHIWNIKHKREINFLIKENKNIYKKIKINYNDSKFFNAGFDASWENAERGK